MSEARAQVEAFLYREARLMDENRYPEWLDLFAPECIYWVPANAEATDPANHVSIIYADRPVLENHVRRLVEGHAYAQQPQSRMRRLVSNVEVESRDLQLHVTANFLITEIRRRTQHHHAGQSIYRLAQHNGEYRIHYKQVNLVGIDEHHDNLTFLL